MARKASSKPEATKDTTKETPAATSPESTAAPVVETAAEKTAPESVEKPVESSTGKAPSYRYRRKAGYRPFEDRAFGVIRPGEILESSRPLPAGFLDGWELLDNPTPEVKLPSVVAVEGGFNVFSADGRKLNDRPLSLKKAQDLINGLSS